MSGAQPSGASPRHDCLGPEVKRTGAQGHLSPYEHICMLAFGNARGMCVDAAVPAHRAGRGGLPFEAPKG